MDPLQPQDPTELGDWKIIARLASSENSNIYLGHRGIEGLEQAAIKVLSEEISSDLNAIDRLKVEAEALKKINNPHIAKLIDYNFENKPVWIATEYIDRKTLDAKLKQDGKPITGQEWWQLAAKIFNGLKAIHSEKIIHKDIKPANIIISGEQVKIIDFGISYVPGNTGKIDFSAIQFEGSRPFAAPENFNGKDSEKMDVFSAAVTLAYAGRLRSIWNDENESTLRNSVIKEKPDLTGLEPEQIELLEPLLDKFPSKRPSSEKAEDKILQYIEFLVGKIESKPKALKGSTFAYRFIKNRTFRIAFLALMLSILVLTMITKSPNTIYLPSPSSTPNAITSKTPTSSSNNSDEITNTGESQECSRLANAENIPEAEKVCLPAANKGDVASMNELGFMYINKIKDEKQGIYWLEKAAEKGYAIALYNLGTWYSNSDPIKSEKYFKKCIGSAYAYCSFNYGLLLQKQNRIPEAKNAYARGANLKDSGSAQNLGLIYAEEGNIAKAKELFTIGADLNNHLSAYSLGKLYIKDLADYELGCKWLYQSSKIDKTYIPAKTDVINICKNRIGYQILDNSEYKSITRPPYITSGKYESGNWILWLKYISNGRIDYDASSITGIQYKMHSSTEDWRYVFYKYLDNEGGIYAVVEPPTTQKNACLDFRLVKEVSDGKISQVWTTPESICVS